MNSAAAEQIFPETDRQAEWRTICSVEDLTPDTGVRALLDGRQVAVFRVAKNDRLYAIDAVDPFTGAAVLSRGIVGDIRGEIVVASPIFKQHFSLETGRCLEDGQIKVATYPIRVNDGTVQLCSKAE